MFSPHEAKTYDLKWCPSARQLGEGCEQAASGAEKGSFRDKKEAIRNTGLGRPGRDLHLREERRRSRAERLPWVLWLGLSLAISGN